MFWCGRRGQSRGEEAAEDGTARCLLARNRTRFALAVAVGGKGSLVALCPCGTSVLLIPTRFRQGGCSVAVPRLQDQTTLSLPASFLDPRAHAGRQSTEPAHTQRMELCLSPRR